MRIDAFASSVFNPIAVNTCDGSIAADEHALPVAISTFGAFTITASAMVPTIRMLDVFGIQSVFLPFTTTSEMRRIILFSK